MIINLACLVDYLYLLKDDKFFLLLFDISLKWYYAQFHFTYFKSFPFIMTKDK